MRAQYRTARLARLEAPGRRAGGGACGFRRSGHDRPVARRVPAGAPTAWHGARRHPGRGARLGADRSHSCRGEPARLPPGGGTAVLNFIAALAAEQGAGPSPTAAPIRASSSSWRCWSPSATRADAGDPLAAFVAAESRVAARALRAPVRRRRSLRAAARPHREGRLARHYLLSARVGRASCATPRAACVDAPEAGSTAGSGRSGASSKTHCCSARAATSRSSPTRPRPRRVGSCPPRCGPAWPRGGVAARAAAPLASSWKRPPGRSRSSGGRSRGISFRSTGGRVRISTRLRDALAAGLAAGAGHGRSRRGRAGTWSRDGGAGGRCGSAGARRPRCLKRGATPGPRRISSGTGAVR